MRALAEEVDPLSCRVPRVRVLVFFLIVCPLSLPRRRVAGRMAFKIYDGLLIGDAEASQESEFIELNKVAFE